MEAKNKIASQVSVCGSLAPPPKKKQKVTNTIEDSPPVGADKNVGDPKNLSHPVITPPMFADMVVDQTGRHSSPLVVVHKAGDSFHVADLPVPLFTPQPYIPTEDRLVTVGDSALNDNGVAFALAHILTFPKNKRNMEAVGTSDLGAISFQRLIAVSFSLPFCLHTIFFCSVVFLTNLCCSSCSSFTTLPSFILGKPGT